MDLKPIIDFLVKLHPLVPVILSILGALVVIGQVVVAITPSKSDDAFVAKVMAIPVLGHLLKAVAAFAPLQKK